MRPRTGHIISLDSAKVMMTQTDYPNMGTDDGVGVAAAFMVIAEFPFWYLDIEEDSP